MKKTLLITLLLISTLLLTSCGLEQYSKARSEKNAKEDTSKAQIATPEKPFIPVQEYYILEQHRKTRIDFSLYVHDGEVIGQAIMKEIGDGNTISCKGPQGDRTFGFTTEMKNLNPIDDEVITFTAHMEPYKETEAGNYKCSANMYNDLGTRVYTTRFEVKVNSEQ